jgi:hypothetical protein
MPSLSYLEIAQVAVRVLPAAACVPYPPHFLPIHGEVPAKWAEGPKKVSPADESDRPQRA